MYSLSPELINAYDDLFICNTNRLPLSFFSSSLPRKSHKLALELIRYAIESRLGWNKYQIRDYLTMDVIIALKLRPVFRYIIFPEGFSPLNSLFYIAWCLFPETQNKSIIDVELETYDAFLNDRLYKMPKFYFDGTDGLSRAHHCLIFAINKYHPISDNELFFLYEFFSSLHAITFLSKMSLLKICELYDMRPLDFLHSSLPNNQRMDIFYSYFDFLLQFDSFATKKAASSSLSDKKDSDSKEDGNNQQ